MTTQIFFASSLEFLLILLSTAFLLKPALVFRDFADKSGSALTFMGMFFLCLTFCWSVILGCILFLNDIVIR